MQAITDFGKIQTFYPQYRPKKDPFCSKGLYYIPWSLNKDPGVSTSGAATIPKGHMLTEIDLIKTYFLLKYRPDFGSFEQHCILV